MFTLRKNFKNIIFVLYSIIIFIVYYGGIIKKLIHPRMYTFILVSGFLLLIFSFIEIMFLKKNQLKRINLTNIVYLIPITLFFFINGANLSNKIIKNKGIDIGINAASLKDTSKNKIDNDQTSDGEKKDTDNKTSDEIIDEEGNIIDNDKFDNAEVIELKSGNEFIPKAIDISYDINSYIGKKIIYTGFIYRDDQVLQHQFVVGRLMMTCCAADAGLVGFIATYNKYSELKNDEWYEIKAIIDKTIYNEYEVPYLKIYEVTKVDKPTDEYIY